MYEIHDPNARRIVQLAQESSGPLPVASIPEEEPPESNFDLTDSLYGVQTACGALLFPFLLIAALFGFTMYATGRD